MLFALTSVGAALSRTTAELIAGRAAMGAAAALIYPATLALLTRSHIYAELEHLGQLGLLEATETVQRDAPTKRVYQITLAGSNELQRWLDDTALTGERSRNLFLVRIFFGDRTSRERLAALLDEYEAAARTRIDLLAALVDRLAGRPESVFRRSTAMFGLRHEQAKVDWVTDVRPILLAATAPEDETLTACGGG